MSDFLICDECDKGDYKIYHEENKVEEYICSYCVESEAECLVDGQPACVGCKMNKKTQNKSPADSIRSDQGSYKGNTSRISIEHSNLKPTATKNISDQLKKNLEMHIHKRGDSTVPVEYYKAHKFLQKYITNNFNELLCIYNTTNDGFNPSSFHSKCDDCKNGIIIIISLSLEYEIAAFSWKGIRRGIIQASDNQMGGALIRQNSFEFVPFKDNIVYNLPEGIRFSSDNDLYLNFNEKEKSICNFDPRSKVNQLWTSNILEISVYRLQIAE
jgi:hypothetical protein